MHSFIPDQGAWESVIVAALLWAAEALALYLYLRNPRAHRSMAFAVLVAMLFGPAILETTLAADVSARLQTLDHASLRPTM